jgi:protein-S-isoprenylcysteine O-methyltransferase Ste14
MLLRAIMAFLLLPVMAAGVVPWLVSRIAAPELFRSPVGIVPLLIGCGILLAAVVSFYRRGRGTLAPWDPPQHLVVQDLYRFNRNPMYVGIAAILLGWALLTGSLWCYAYAVVVPLLFHLRVVWYEEREMARLFAGEWESYRAAVPRWGIARRPYRTPGEM